MENASKALLIAAAVLIVILLIAFGMRIFSSVSGTADQVGGTANQIGSAISQAGSSIQQAISQTGLDVQISQYLDKTVSKNEVIDFLNFVKENNSNNADKQIYVSVNAKSDMLYYAVLTSYFKDQDRMEMAKKSISEASYSEYYVEKMEDDKIQITIEK